MQAVITTWENIMCQKIYAYERWYMCNTYVSNFHSLQGGSHRLLEKHNKEENLRTETKKSKIIQGKTTTKIHERW